MRSNQKEYKKQPYIFRKKRKRIETLFSQLCDQFMIKETTLSLFKDLKLEYYQKLQH